MRCYGAVFEYNTPSTYSLSLSCGGNNSEYSGILVGHWSYSELPLVAEAVEKVGAVEKQATFDQANLILGHNDSMGCRILNHCFNFLGPSEFFNNLG